MRDARVRSCSAGSSPASSAAVGSDVAPAPGIRFRWTPITRSGSILPISREIAAPQSPPCTPYRSYPSLVISSVHARATRLNSHPGSVVGPDSVKPGMVGKIRWKSVSNGAMAVNSTIEPGQPCVNTSGIASGDAERRWAKCTTAPSTTVLYCGQLFKRASAARQSYPFRQ